MRCTPCLERAGVRQQVNGPEAFTPDGNPILGPAPEMENVYLAGARCSLPVAMAI